MFAFISNIPIFRRLFLAFVLAAVIPGIIITILGTTFVSGLNTRSQAQQRNLAAVTEGNRLGALLAMTDSLRNQVIFRARQNTPTTDAANAFNSAMGDFDTSSRAYQQKYQVATANDMSDVKTILLNDDPNNAVSQTQQDTLDAVLSTKGLWQTYKDASQAVVAAAANTNGSAGNAQLEEKNGAAAQTLIPLGKAWRKVTDTTQEISTLITQVGPSQVNPIILGTVIAFLSTIMVVIAIGYVVNITITGPLRELALLTRRIAKGDTTARAKIGGRDEIHMVATSMNNMLDNIVRLIQDTQSQRDILQSQVEKLVGEVGGVGDGDLRAQAEVSASALGVLADSFNYMVDELGSLIVRVKTTANEVDSSTATILDRMTELVETGDIQINQITEAAIEVERMSASSRQVAERSQVLYDVARDARQDAQGGREAVQQAIEGMGRINENVLLTAAKVQELGDRSREIDDIVTVISSISHQTNRLALDAAIQAAMAGENGKGFGAVAADIRRLAERAKEQVSSITKIVRNVREEVGAVAISMQDTERETLSGTRLTQEAGAALESIFVAVEQQAREIENINKVAVQQLNSSSAVVQIMHEVSESTQQSGASTRDASHNMERLALLVQKLRSSVEAFKLRENPDLLLSNAGGKMAATEEEQRGQSVSGMFRTVSANTTPIQRSSPGAVFTAKALPAPHASETFSSYTSVPEANGNKDEQDTFTDFMDKEQWYNEPFPSNGSGRGR